MRPAWGGHDRLRGRSTTSLWTFNHKSVDVQPQFRGRTATNLWTYSYKSVDVQPQTAGTRSAGRHIHVVRVRGSNLVGAVFYPVVDVGDGSRLARYGIAVVADEDDGAVRVDVAQQGL